MECVVIVFYEFIKMRGYKVRAGRYSGRSGVFALLATDVCEFILII